MRKLFFYTLLCNSLYLISCDQTTRLEHDKEATASTSDLHKALPDQQLKEEHDAVGLKVHDSLKAYAEKLKQEELTIDPDHNFTVLMAAHHEGALQLSKELEAHAKDDRLREIIKTVVATKDSESAQLRAFASEHIPVKGDTTSTKSFMKPVNRMGQAVPANANESADIQLAKLLLHHHQTGLELIEVELKLGRNPQVREMAQQIKTEQVKGIDLIESWLR
ncbi:DUF305 domain-containing protein [Pontibacter sp. H259]|uniref:DUF305 domain-containing protein n=1 Tax=Pontibacter sp. H259 TaxID=3133421 RepID=UPI0030C02AD6